MQRKEGKVYKPSIEKYNRPSEFAASRAQREIHYFFFFLRELNEIIDESRQDGSDCIAVNDKVGVQYFHETGWHICNITKNMTYNVYSNQCLKKIILMLLITKRIQVKKNQTHKTGHDYTR